MDELERLLGGELLDDLVKVIRDISDRAYDDGYNVGFDTGYAKSDSDRYDAWEN